jgi:hypothetical protein
MNQTMTVSPRSKSVGIAFLVCAGLFLAETAWFRARHSLTFDETLYLSLSVRSVRHGGLDPGFVNSGIAPLPMMLTYFPALWFAPGADRQDLWEGAPDDPQRIVEPRIANSVLIGLPLIGVVLVWLARRRGLLAAGLGGALMACSPTIVAHGGLATTELTFALFALMSLLAIAWMVPRPSLARSSVAGAMIGATIAAKYSGIFLLPVAGLMLACHAESITSGRSAVAVGGRVLRRYACLLLAAGLACWAGHLFTTSGPLKMVPLEETAEYSPWLRILGRGPVADWIMNTAHERLFRPSPIEGIFFQVRHNGEGHWAYLLGEVSKSGWWYYFPCAFAFKSTPVEGLLTGVVLVAILLSLRSPWTSFRSLDAERQAMLLGTAVLLTLLMTSKINIGQRYLILLYPLLVMIGVEQLAMWFESRPRRLAIIAGVLMAGQAASSLAVAPHYLAYFNRFAGGPDNGRWMLGDSNLDWGQDLPALCDFQREHPEPLVFWYFGTALPEAYGVKAVNLEEFPESVERFTYFAVSASYLNGPYGLTAHGGNPFAEFRTIPPFTLCGHSIVVIDLRPPGIRDRLHAAIREFERIARSDPNHHPPRWKSAP